MTGIDSIPTARKEQDILKEKLLAGKMLPNEIFEKMLILDQSTPDRRQAFANYELLTDDRVAIFIQTQSPENQSAYYKILGFTEFHLGQIKALEDQSGSEALKFFKASLEHAHQGHEDEEWTSYVVCTVAYFDENLEELNQASLSPEIIGNNRKIVENMKKGLRERGSMNYREDYLVE